MATQPAEVVETLDGDALEPDNEIQSQPRDFEAEARAQGWTPKEDFRGDESRWVDAETFVKRADEVMPLLKKKTQNQDREIAELKKQIKRLTRAEAAAYENALADLKAEAEAAVEAGDLTAYRAVDKKLEALRKDAEEDAGPAHGEVPAEQYEAFREANAWYDRGNLAGASEIEIDARAYADRLADKYARQGLQNEMAPSAFFDRIARETEERFPLLKARKSREKPPSPVEGVTRTQANKGAKTYANLPADAQRQADRFHAQGVYGKATLDEARAKYAASYQWS
jgi:hypothetical protein